MDFIFCGVALLMRKSIFVLANMQLFIYCNNFFLQFDIIWLHVRKSVQNNGTLNAVYVQLTNLKNLITIVVVQLNVMTGIVVTSCNNIFFNQITAIAKRKQIRPGSYFNYHLNLRFVYSRVK